MDTKTCNRCHREQPIEEFRLGATIKGKRYRAPHCNECHRADVRAYRVANLEKVRASDAARHKANPEPARARARAWYYANKERARAQRAATYARDPELTRDRAGMTRAKKAGASVIEFVRRREVFERDGGICHECNDPVEWADYEMDHVKPLSEGGDHSYANVRVSHKRCNLARRPLPTHCPRNHPYNDANTYRKRDGSRSCRACARERAREKQEAASAG